MAEAEIKMVTVNIDAAQDRASLGTVRVSVNCEAHHVPVGINKDVPDYIASALTDAGIKFEVVDGDVAGSPAPSAALDEEGQQVDPPAPPAPPEPIVPPAPPAPPAPEVEPKAPAKKPSPAAKKVPAKKAAKKPAK